MPTSALFFGFTGTAVRAARPQPCLRRPTFSAAPEKVCKKRRRGRVILRAHARDFLAALRLKRPIRAQKCSFTYSLWFRPMYYTQMWADCINFGSAHFRNTQPANIHAQHVVGADAYIGHANIVHHRRIRRCVLNCIAACFTISMRGNDSRWERCPHAGGAVVQFCREIPVCWPQCSSTG